MVRLRNILILQMILISIFIFGQEDKDLSIFYTSYFGKGVGGIKGIESNHSESYMLGIVKKLDQEKLEWARRLNAEQISISFIHSDLEGIKRGYTFGKAYGLLSEIDFKLFNKNQFFIYFTPGLGLSYIDKTIFTNPETYIFGTHINAMFNLALKGKYQINQDIDINTEVGLMHYSNGAYRIPNAGVNTLNFGLGISKNLKSNLKYRQSSLHEMSKNGIELSAGIGQRGKYKQKDGFTKYAFYAGYNRFINNVFGFRIGLDGIYHPEVFNPLIYNDTVPYWGRTYDHLTLGASVGAELKMNHFALHGNWGTYLYMKSPTNQKTYWKLGLKYYITPKFGVQTILNAHKFQADFVSWGLFVRM